MDRASQLKNVAFGGAWSQDIPRRERFAEAVRLLKGCPDRTRVEDLREDRALADAIGVLCDANPKGETIRHSWERAMTIPDAGVRSLELLRLVRAIEVWVSGR
ncbi:hypothetical protein [Paracoccus sp. ME4]|uniref:hypothetical protein n=1 Tax=Paracoccus sp. ME4 TaxID=3138066 RepID=UPI00398AA83C